WECRHSRYCCQLAELPVRLHKIVQTRFHSSRVRMAGDPMGILFLQCPADNFTSSSDPVLSGWTLFYGWLRAAGVILNSEKRTVWRAPRILSELPNDWFSPPFCLAPKTNRNGTEKPLFLCAVVLKPGRFYFFLDFFFGCAL